MPSDISIKQIPYQVLPARAILHITSFHQTTVDPKRPKLYRPTRSFQDVLAATKLFSAASFPSSNVSFAQLKYGATYNQVLGAVRSWLLNSNYDSPVGSIQIYWWR